MLLNQLVGLFLALVYLKDLVLTLPHPGELVFIIDTTIHPSDAAGSPGVSSHFMSLQKTK